MKEYTILFINDEIHHFEPFLEGLDVNPLTARSGEEGIELFRVHEKEIDLILMDWSMATMSGDEATKIIRNINKDVKIIRWSFDKNVTYEELKNLGYDDYIDYSQSFTEIQKIIEKYIKKNE